MGRRPPLKRRRITGKKAPHLCGFGPMPAVNAPIHTMPMCPDYTIPVLPCREHIRNRWRGPGEPPLWFRTWHERRLRSGDYDLTAASRHSVSAATHSDTPAGPLAPIVFLPGGLLHENSQIVDSPNQNTLETNADSTDSI